MYLAPVQTKNIDTNISSIWALILELQIFL